MEPHRKLEGRLAEFKGTESALLFGSGYLANLGVVSALAGRDGVVFSDELNHASIIDGCRLSRAETFVYRHRDLEHLEYGLNQAGSRAQLIVTDGVFSMDGDVAPLIELVELARRYGCRIAVDEAHGTGALGPGGRGAVAAAGLSGEVDVVVGTLGKALGSYGAYVCASAELVELLVNVSRPFIFSTAPPPPSVGAALAALGLLSARPGLVEQLRRNGATLREALAAHGLDRGPLANADRAGDRRRRAPGDGALRALARPRRLRPGDPAADGSRGQLAAAADGDGEPPKRRAPSRGEVDRPRRRRARDRRRGAARARPGRLTDARRGARRLRHRNRDGGRQDRRRGRARANRGRRRRTRPRLQAGAQRARRGRRARPRAAAPRRRLAASPTTRSRPTASGRRSHRTSAPSSPASAISPERLRDAAAAAGDGADLLVCEGVGGFLVPLTLGYLIRDFARDLGLPGRRSSPRPGSGRSTTRC